MVVLRIEHNLPVKCQPSAGLSFFQTLEQDPAMKPSVAKRGGSQVLAATVVGKPYYGKLMKPKLLSGQKRRKGEADFFTPLPHLSFLLMQPI